jgi:multidrug transporter EmrE-like cation transporter
MAMKIGFILGCIVLAPTGNLLLKHGMMQVGDLSHNSGGLLAYALKTFTRPEILVGMAMYIGSFVLWLGLLSMMDISIVYPVFVSAAFIIVTVASMVWFGEAVNATRMIGIAVVVAGIAIVSISGHRG